MNCPGNGLYFDSSGLLSLIHGVAVALMTKLLNRSDLLPLLRRCCATADLLNYSLLSSAITDCLGIGIPAVMAMTSREQFEHSN